MKSEQPSPRFLVGRIYEDHLPGFAGAEECSTRFSSLSFQMPEEMQCIGTREDERKKANQMDTDNDDESVHTKMENKEEAITIPQAEKKTLGIEGPKNIQ